MKKKEENVNYKTLNQLIGTSNKIVKILYILLILAVIALIIFLLKEINFLPVIGGIFKIVSPLFIGIVIAWLFDPFVKWLNKKGVSRVLGAVLSFVILFVIIFLFFTFLVPVLYDQINDFISLLPGTLSTISNWIEELFDSFAVNGMDLTTTKLKIFENLENFGAGLTSDLPTTLVNFVGSLLSGVGIIMLGFVVGFYLLIDFDGASKCVKFVPKKYREEIIGLGHKLNTAFRNYIQGTLKISLIMIVISSLGFWVIGLKAPILFGLIVGITNIIPYIGPWIGGAIAALVGFVSGPLIGILAVLVAFIAQQIDGVILQPIVLGKTMKLHPVTIMVGLLIFGYLFGILGMILATPIIACVKIIYLYFDDKYHFRNKLGFVDDEIKVNNKSEEEKK